MQLVGCFVPYMLGAIFFDIKYAVGFRVIFGLNALIFVSERCSFRLERSNLCVERSSFRL